MNAERLYKNIREHSLNESSDPTLLYKCDSDVVEYVKSHCYHPIKLSLFDSHLGHFVTRLVPCGNCYHCRETKVNEWVTRLYAHCEDYKYVYFLTLTYRSFEKDETKPAALAVMKYLDKAYWHYDSFNSFGRSCYRPCVLVKSHYQNFFKRLRKNTKNDSLSYFGCGEYGKKFGSPHFHFILFSNQPISLRDCQRAWGCFLDSNGNTSRNNKDKHFYSFGRIELDDLVENGTFGKTDITVDNIRLNPRMCFAYVAKYVGKKEYNKHRVFFLVNDITDYPFRLDINDYSNETEKKDLSACVAEYYDQFKPFITCSRGCPIGSLFLNRHIEDMAKGVYCKPPLLDKNVVIVPSYFRKKAKEFLFPYRSIKENSSFTLGNMSLVAANLATYIKSDLSTFINKGILQSDILARQSSKYPISFFDTLNCDSLDSIPSNFKFDFIDLRSRSRFIFCYNMSIHEPFVAAYKFNRSKRCYTWSASYNLETWILHYLTSMADDFAEYLKQFEKSKLSIKYLDWVDTFYKSYSDVPVFSRIAECVETQNDNFFKFKNSNRYNNSTL